MAAQAAPAGTRVVAFATSIDCLSATPRGSNESFSPWFRVTVGLRRIDGRWLVTHEHESVPFEMFAPRRGHTASVKRPRAIGVLATLGTPDRPARAWRRGRRSRAGTLAG